MTRPDGQLALEALAEEIQRCQRSGDLVFELPWTLALLWVSHLQLALRHPQLNPDTAEMVKGSLHHLIDLIALRAPLAARMLLLGFDPDYDLGSDRHWPQ